MINQTQLASNNAKTLNHKHRETLTRGKYSSTIFYMNILFLFKITKEFIKTLRRDFSNDNETRALTELCTEARRQLWSKNKQLIFNVDGDDYKNETEEEKNARKQNNKKNKK